MVRFNKYPVLILGLMLVSCGWFSSSPIIFIDGDVEEFESETLDETVQDTQDMEVIEEEIQDTTEMDGLEVPEVVMDLQEDREDMPPDIPMDEGEEEFGPAICGNGIQEPGEACDDHNWETEFCGRGLDCLADCSMLEGECGDGEPDAGEDCDDGNSDSMDGCTTSCTHNDRNIGDPCTCSGAGCGTYDFTAGTIEGCENVVVPDGSGGLLACLRDFSYIGLLDIFHEEGYCSIMALSCEGTLCGLMIDDIGDIDTFECPPGYVEHEDVRVIMGTTITTKSCLRTCVSSSECRWNAMDPSTHRCGQYDCIPLPDSTTIRVCEDGRNFE